MRHPMIPCPEHLKAVFVETLEGIKRDTQAKSYLAISRHIRICYGLTKAAEADDAKLVTATEAMEHIQGSLGPLHTSNGLEDWLWGAHDPEYRRLYRLGGKEHIDFANKVRVEWLEWLIKPREVQA